MLHRRVNRVFILSVLAFFVGCSSLPIVAPIDDRFANLRLLHSDIQRIEAISPTVNGSYPTMINIIEGSRPVIDLYRQDHTHDVVLSFFTELTGSEEITLAILRHAERKSIPALLSFSLAWAESSFNPYAINANASSIDRGLFQLNSRSFYWLSDADFYDLDINSRHAHDYLADCMHRSSYDYKMALAMYNAGMYRVLLGMTPLSTQRYVIKISAYYEELQQRYKQYILSHYPSHLS